MSSERNPLDLIPLWLEATRGAGLETGMRPEEALERAARLRESLRASEAAIVPNDIDPSVFHGLSEILSGSDDGPIVLLGDGSRAFELLSRANFPDDGVGERQSLLADFAFICWSAARRLANPALEDRWLKAFSMNLGRSPVLSEELSQSLKNLKTAHSEAIERQIWEPRALLSVVCYLGGKLEKHPRLVRMEAETIYSLLETQAGAMVDRHFLGVLALAAGTASRLLRSTDDASMWFERAESALAVSQNANAHLARVEYQRLALAAEERQTELVLKQAPVLANTFMLMGLAEDELKCRFLEAVAWAELGKTDRAIKISQDTFSTAQTIGSDRLAALAASNLVLYLGTDGRHEEALAWVQKALAPLRQRGDNVYLVRFGKVLGKVLRQNEPAAALVAFRQAQAEAQELGLRGETAELHLMIAELCLEAGLSGEAEQELHAALPIIDEEKMVPEGIAALSLLRESLRRRQIDKQALRDLHGYFREK